MLLKLEPFDPSDDFTINYKDTKTLQIYKKLSEQRLDIDKNNLYNEQG